MMSPEGFNEIGSVATALGSLVTAVGVVVAVIQLRFARKQRTADFEDAFTREYRSLLVQFPKEVFLNTPLAPEDYRKAYDSFYLYFDLCNEQAFHREQGRVSGETWTFWHDGMKSNLARPAFAKAWNDISGAFKSDFNELRRLFPPSSS